jgi:hypothetical protein
MSSGDILSARLRGMGDADLHKLLSAVSLQQGIPYMRSFENLERGLKQTSPDCTAYQALAAVGIDGADLVDDLDVLAGLEQAKGDVRERAERSLRALDAESGGGSQSDGVPISDRDYEAIHQQAPQPVYSRLRRARRLDRRYQDEAGECRFAADDLLNAQSNRDLSNRQPDDRACPAAWY